MKQIHKNVNHQRVEEILLDYDVNCHNNSSEFLQDFYMKKFCEGGMIHIFMFLNYNNAIFDLLMKQNLVRKKVFIEDN